MLTAGDVAHQVFFVEKGILRQHFVDEGGNERTCNFAFENEFLTDLESFSRQTESATGISVLEPAECLVADCVTVARALRTSPAVAEFLRIFVEYVATENIRRTKSMLSLSPERQLDELAKNKPQILQRVPQRYVAQYLGLAPESLSRIRRRMMEQQKS